MEAIEQSLAATVKFIDKLRFYLIKLPFILVIVPIGFVLEFMICFPFFIICVVDGWFQQSHSRRS